MTSGARILVAEDDLDIRRAIVAELRGEGYQTVEASDGREALAGIRNAKPDLIVTDLAMPVMDGFALIEAARKRSTSARTISSPSRSRSPSCSREFARCCGGAGSRPHRGLRFRV